MWRSNVLRLRSCSSIPSQLGLKRRWYSSNTGSPVGKEEFLEALEKVHPKHKWFPHLSLGLAVSGGVDSMALATLYAQAANAHANLPTCHGFIIDHKVRPESTEEAEWVAQQLRWKFNMQATVISLTWPENYDPFDSRRFETEARTLRYQALGRACKEHRIGQLMVAHHADDQAETVMMRLMNMRWRSGLQGMHPVEWIPECYGMHGVHHSGALDIPGKRLKHEADPTEGPFQVEEGGVQILRPLLGFEKSRLIATCEESGTSWAEDKTNQIQTLTARNAIRHVFKNHKLPEALSIPSLVKVSQHMRTRIDSHKTHAETLFNNLPLKLDVQTGSLVARLPPVAELLDRHISFDSDRDEARNNAYFLLERLADLVSPREKAPISQLASAILRIYPSLAQEDEEASNVPQPKKNFCVFGVWWRHWGQPSPFDDSTAQPHAMEWLLSRQPPEEFELNESSRRIVFPPSSASVPLSPTTTPIPQWHLFDGRFWILVQNNTSNPLVLRLLSDVELRTLSSRKRSSPSKDTERHQDPNAFIHAALQLIKPSPLRRQLPAIFLLDPDTKEEKILCLPTLGAKSILEDEHNMESSTNPPFSVQIRYKKIDPGSRQLKDLILPGIRREHIMAEERRIRHSIAGNKRLKTMRDSVVGDEDASDPFSGFKKIDKKQQRSEKAWMDRGRNTYRKRGGERTSERAIEARDALSGHVEGMRKSYKLFERPKERKSRIGWRDFESRV